MTTGERAAGPGVVVAVCKDAAHRFSKQSTDVIRLVAGLGVEGDAHFGVTVQHLSRIAQNPQQPNLRQVHLLHGELHDELTANGLAVAHGAMGENITTRGIDLLALPRGALLRLGEDAVVEITGLRNPCAQLDRFQPGLMQAVLGRDADGALVRKAGVMAIVIAGGQVRGGHAIVVTLPPQPHVRLERV